MPRRPRVCPAGTCFHVLNRAVARLTLFEKIEDYEAFERVLEEAIEREPLPIFSYCVMPNHWHFVVRPKASQQVSSFFRWLTHTHTMRWHAHYQTQGEVAPVSRTRQHLILDGIDGVRILGESDSLFLSVVSVCCSS